MKKIILLISLLMPLTSFAAKQNSFQKDLNTLLKSVDDGINFSLVISDTPTKKILFKKNADQNFAPASILKIVTAFAGLSYLGPDYRYKTSILADITKLSTQSSTYDGNIYIKFSGDPSLSIADIDNLMHQLTLKNIKQINGSVLIDDMDQDQLGWSDGTMLEDTKFCYTSPVTAIIINNNCINAEAKITEDKKIIIESNENNFVKIQNELRYSPTKDAADLTAHENNHYLITGSLTTMTPLKIAVQNNRLFCQNIILDLLNNHQIIAKKGVSFGRTPTNAQTLTIHESLPLNVLTTEMLKQSDNIIANAIFRSLAVFTRKGETTWEGGIEAVRQLLETKLKIRPNQFTIKDGAGESGYNLIKPIQILNLLNYLATTDPSFKEMLPHAGVDGTLKNQLKNSPIEVYAKIGTETGISSLAGYLKTKKQHPVTFVMFINHGLLDRHDYRALEEKICILIYQHF